MTHKYIIKILIKYHIRPSVFKGTMFFVLILQLNHINVMLIQWLDEKYTKLVMKQTRMFLI